MIAALEWIPAGRAAPSPRKYEPSRAEREFLRRVREGTLAAADEEDAEGEDEGKEGGAASEDEWEDVDEEEEEGGAKKLPAVDPASLPADLRMDDYSDGEGDGEEGVGGLLMGEDAEMAMMGAPDDPEVRDQDRAEDDDGSSDSEDEDDLADVPDTREYLPLDVEGLHALGIGGGRGVPLGPEREGGYTMEDLQAMTMTGEEWDDDDDDDEDDVDDAEDTRIREGDALLVVAKTEEDFASLEINVFDTRQSNLYVHHDIPLPSFPLCLALGSVAPSFDGETNGASSGNYVAVGSFEPGIEIWNLDVTHALEPTVVLGGMDTQGAEEEWLRTQMPSSTMVGGKRKKKKTKGPKAGGNGLREGSHADAVMGLSWNAVHRQVLASGSADGTVKLWDVTGGGSGGDYVRPSATLTHHTDKVPSLAWHPSEGTLLATGGYDRRVCLVDARSAAAGQSHVKKAKLTADCEALSWDPHRPQCLAAASEDGTVRCWDVRKFGADPVWSVVAHEYGGVSDICYNAKVPGMFVTCSIDKTVALWDTHGTNGASSPTPCGSKDMNVGKLYSVSCYPSAPWLLACGGSGNDLAIWDMEGEEAIQKRFGGRVNGGGGGAPASEDGTEPDFEAVMATEGGAATEKALQGATKSKKKKGKKKGKVHKKR